MRTLHSYLLLFALLTVTGCVSATVKVFDDYSEPLKEFTLKGDGQAKVLMLPIRGFISSDANPYALLPRPSVVQEVAAHLDLAGADPDVRAVVLMVSSSGGTVTGSDILYREISRFREQQGIPVVACLMDMATSGAYFAALAADRIVAHPTTVTGSVGTVFLQPRIEGLMGKVGVEVEAYKSGRHKDMGAFFRSATDEERAMFQALIDDVNQRFLSTVKERRSIAEKDFAAVADARIFTAGQALKIGMVDRIGYVQDAVAEAMHLGKLPDNSRQIVYRRTLRPNDTIYNLATSESHTQAGLLGLDLSPLIPLTGFYHLWAPSL